jgi:hypothetical protein
MRRSLADRSSRRSSPRDGSAQVVAERGVHALGVERAKAFDDGELELKFAAQIRADPVLEALPRDPRLGRILTCSACRFLVGRVESAFQRTRVELSSSSRQASSSGAKTP